MAYGVEIWGWEEKVELRREDNDELCKMNIWLEFLCTEICDNERTGDGKTKSGMGN